MTNESVVDEPTGHQLHKNTPYYKMSEHQCMLYLQAVDGMKLSKQKADRVYDAALRLNVIESVIYHDLAAIDLTSINGQNYIKYPPLGVAWQILEYYNWFLILMFTVLAAVYSYLGYYK